MSATFDWMEDNGTQSGSPARGTPTPGPNNCDWKSIDDTTTSRQSSPVPAGGFSFPKYQYGRIGRLVGFNQLTNGLWSHSATTPSSPTLASLGITLWGKVSSNYVTPATNSSSLVAGMSDISADLAIGSSTAAVKFSATGPYDQSPLVTINGTTVPVYTQYLVTQVQLGSSVAPGDSPLITFTLRYDEN